MNLIRFLLRSSRVAVIAATLAGVLGGAGSVGLLALIHDALDRADGAVALPLGAFLGLCLLVLLTRVVAQTLLVRLGQSAVYDLGLHLSRRLLDTPLRQLERLGSPRLLAALTADVPVVANALVGVPLLLVNLAIVLGCLVYLGWLSLSVLGAVLGFLVLGVGSYQLLASRALHHLKLARTEQDALQGHFRSLIDGVKELQLHRARRQGFVEQDLQAVAAALRDHTAKGLTVYAAAASWGQLLFFVLIALLLTPTLGSDVSWSTRAGYTLTILYAMSPLEVVLSWLPILARARVALRNLEELGLAIGSPPVATGGLVAPAPELTSLELAAVTHTYRHEREGDGFLLGPIDLTLWPGEVVFLVGHNGSGKSTLAKLLTGLYQPEAGVIRWNGRPVADVEAYRQLFSVVFADFFLFERLRGLGVNAHDDRIANYLRLLELDHKVQIRDGLLSTTALSQGQRRRLALLTAYLEDRPVYVLDEWASDQDPRFKQIFYTQLLPELKARGKAVLVISQDERYFGVADRLLRLEDGRLVTTPELEGHRLATVRNGSPVPS
jgi:putative ATP-binding cassette transporter